MRPRRLADGTPSFAGGLNLVDDATQLRPDELQQAQNVDLDSTGTAFRARGTRRTSVSAVFTPDNDTGAGLGCWVDPVSGKMLVGGWPNDGFSGFGNFQLWVAQPSASFPWTWTSCTGFSAVSGILGAAPQRPAFANLNGTVYVTLGLGSGNSFYKSTNLTAWTAISSAISTTFLQALEVYNSRLFACKTSDRRLFFSDLDSGDTLGDPALGGGYVDLNGIGNLVAIVTSREYLFLFHQGSISAYVGWSAEDVDILAGQRGVSSSVGLANRHAIVRAPDQSIYFAGSDGDFYRLAPDGVLRNLSLRQDGARRLLRGTAASYTMASCDPSRGLVLFTNVSSANASGVATAGYVYNYQADAWTTRTFDGTTASPNGLAFSTVLGEGQMFALCSDGHVRAFTGTKQNAASDGSSGTEYTLTLKSKKFTFGDVQAAKALRYAYLKATGALATVPTLTLNGGAGAGAVAGSDLLRYQVASVDADAEVTVTDAAMAEAVGLSALSLEGFVMARRFG